jgi:hypothetical protein
MCTHPSTNKIRFTFTKTGTLVGFSCTLKSYSNPQLRLISSTFITLIWLRLRFYLRSRQLFDLFDRKWEWLKMVLLQVQCKLFKILKTHGYGSTKMMRLRNAVLNGITDLWCLDGGWDCLPREDSQHGGCRNSSPLRSKSFIITSSWGFSAWRLYELESSEVKKVYYYKLMRILSMEAVQTRVLWGQKGAL